jgi:glycosyltransferase involved in cell wall biosynthesis
MGVHDPETNTVRLMIITAGGLRREYGGGQVYVRNLVEALTEAGHEVNVTGDVDDITRTKPDIVHAHGLKEAAGRAARKAGVPCVVTMHHGGLVCPRGALLDWQDCICHRPAEQKLCTRCCLGGRWWGYVSPAAGEFLKRLPNIPFITPDMMTPHVVARKREEIANLARDVTMFVAPSAAAQEAFVRNGIARERTAVVPHGIRPLAARPVPSQLRFAYVGRICREKGLHVLIEAFRRLRGDAELHVLGAAHNKWEQRYLRSLGKPSRVIFHGHLTGDALAAAWAQCSVTVLPSICMEVFGLVVAESFSLGRPVIVTDCGGPTEQVRDGVDGFVVPPNDVNALAVAMQRFADGARLDVPKPRTMAEHVQELETRVYSVASA